MIKYHEDRVRWHVLIALASNVSQSRRQKKLKLKAQHFTLKTHQKRGFLGLKNYW